MSVSCFFGLSWIECMFGIFAYFLSPAVRRWRQQCPKGVCRCRPALSHPSYGGRSCSCGWTKQVNWNTYVRGCVPILQNCGDFPDSIWLTFNNRTSKGSVYGVPCTIATNITITADGDDGGDGKHPLMHHVMDLYLWMMMNLSCGRYSNE